MIKQLYEDLKGNPGAHHFRASALGDSMYLGVDAQQRPALFIENPVASSEPPLRTAQVSFRPHAPFTLTTSSGGPVRGTFDALQCESYEAASVDTFLVLVDGYVSRAAVDRPRLPDFFRAIVRLLAVPPSRDLAGERQGLWGELFMMRAVRGFAFWTPFWHTEPSRRFDFSSDGRRVEVKTALGGQRIHHFAHRQIFALADEEIFIASLLVEPDDAGLDLRALIDECRSVIAATPHFMSLERAVRRAGMEDPVETGPAFDSANAMSNLAWFDSRSVPHFRVPEPPGVSDTRYRVDLSTAPRLDPDRLESWLGLWSSAATTTG